MITKISLRGGGVGCCSRSNVKKPALIDLSQNHDDQLLSGFDHFLDIVHKKASLAANKQEQQEIMIAIQYFLMLEENIQELNRNTNSAKKYYQLIIRGIYRLLNSCPIYLKTDSVICLYILQITTSLSKIIYTYHILNHNGYMLSIEKKNYLDICEKIRLQAENEKNDLIQNQIQLFLYLTQTPIEIAPTIFYEMQDILTVGSKVILKQIINMSLATDFTDLLESLFQYAQKFYKQYDIVKKERQYQLYYQLDILQWRVINQFRNNQCKSLETIIFSIKQMYEITVKNSANWKDHYLWVQMIGKIILYNPLLTMNRLQNVLNQQNLREKPIHQIWEDFKTKRLLIQLNYDSYSGVIQLSQLENNKTEQNDRVKLGFFFKGWENFLLLKEFLLKEQQDNIQYNFRSYLQSKLDFEMEDNKLDLNIFPITKIQKFFSFNISDELLELIKQNLDKLEEIIQTGESVRNNKIINLKIFQSSYKTEIKKIIGNLEDYSKTTLNIRKILCLFLEKNDFLTEHSKQTGLLDYEYFISLLRLLKQALEQSIIQRQDDKEEDSQMLNSSIQLIKDELLKCYQDVKSLQIFKKKLSEFESYSQKYSKFQFIQESQEIVSDIDQIEQLIQSKKIEEYEKQGVIISFKNLLHKLYSFYEQKFEEIQKDFLNSIQNHRDIFIGLHQIESVSSYEDFEIYQTRLCNLESLQIISNSRFNLLKLDLHLMSFKDSFQKLLDLANQDERQKLLQVISFNQFLFDAIIKYPIKINNLQINIQDYFDEIKLINITENELKSKLSVQKGIIQYHLFKIQLVEQEVDLERIDLELIKKEFSEIFIEKSISIQQIDSINKILEIVPIDKSLKHVVSENFNEDQLKIEKLIYESLYNELRKFKGSQFIVEAKQIINQTEIVLDTFRNSENKHISISQILIHQVLIGLQNQIKQYHANVKLVKQETQQLQSGEVNHYLKNLDFLIKLLTIQKSKIIKQKQGLQKIFIGFDQLLNSISIIEKQSIEIQNEMLMNFNNYFQNQIKQIEKLQWIQNDLELLEKQNLKIDYDQILNNFQQETSESEQQQEFKIQMKYTNSLDYFHKLKIIFKQEMTNTNYLLDETQLEQENIINQIKKLYFGEREKVNKILQYEENSQSELGFFDNCLQKYNDFRNNHEWKIKQGLIFTLIQISSNCLSSPITQFCQQALVQLWGKEKDKRIRNLLKNQNLLGHQIQILQKDWQTQHDRIESEMKQMLQKIDNLQDQISHEVNLNEREKKLTELDETTQQLDEYISNKSEMGQQLKLITDFLNNLRKSLSRVEGKINEMKHQLKDMGNDIKFLRGKSVTQLLEIRKWKVLKEAATRNLKSIYLPLMTLEKTAKGIEEPVSNLMNLDRFDDRKGEVNEFLSDGKQTVLLIHGKAGSGKSTTARKIEEFIWKLHDKNIQFNNRSLIPIYISLPSLKNPVSQVVEEALCQSEYGFDDLQLKERYVRKERISIVINF